MSIEVRLDNNYFFDTDPLNWILKKKYIVEKGKSQGSETISTVGSYGDVPSAIHGYMNHALHDEFFYGGSERTVSIYYVLDALARVERNALEATNRIKVLAEEWKSSQSKASETGAERMGEGD